MLRYPVSQGRPQRAAQRRTRRRSRTPPRSVESSGGPQPGYFGRSILHVVGSAVALPSTFASDFQPRPESSLSYLTFRDSVDTNSGCSNW